MEQLVILYGTQTGNAERLALRIGRNALSQGVRKVICAPADDVPIEKWLDFHSPLLFVCANANQGEAPDTFRQTWCRLLDAECPSLDGLEFAVFGVGDSLYAKFNYMGKMLHNRLRQLGGVPLLLRGLGDESDAKGLDEALAPFLRELWAALGLQSQEGGSGVAPTISPYFPLLKVSLISPQAGAAEGGLARPVYSKPTFECVVTENRRITAEDYEGNVHHMCLELVEGSAATIPPPHEVGDALAVYCPNRGELVEELLLRLGVPSETRVLVESDASRGLEHRLRLSFADTIMSIGDLFLYHFDLDAVVTQEFFGMMAGHVHGDDEDAVDTRERLTELADPTKVDDYLQYAYREKRNLCEVLHDFKTIQPPLEDILTFLPRMTPRYFSIASPSREGPRRYELCVAQLAWQTPLKRHRTGLCSSYLVEAPVGQRLVCGIWEGSLSLPPAPTPLLCIATGTGIAPLRALLHHCALHSSDGWREMPIFLFFGCRYEGKDFLYRAEWEQLQKSGALSELQVVPAFSRDTEKKVYVQHQLGQHARQVSALLHPAADATTPPAVVYLCGNAKQMPKDVQSALEQILAATAFDGDSDAAALFLRGFSREGRYQVDTWSA